MNVSEVIMVNQFLNQAERDRLTVLYLKPLKPTKYLATDLAVEIYYRRSTDRTDTVQRKKTRLEEETLRLVEDTVFTCGRMRWQTVRIWKEVVLT